MTRKIGLGILALLVLGGAFFLFRSPVSAFKEQAAFEDKEQNRIYAIVFDPGATLQAVKGHALSLAFAAGRLTTAYFYPDYSGVPRDGVTFADSLDQANRVIYESRGFGPWRFAFMRDAEGGIRFVDCRETPDDELCRKE